MFMPTVETKGGVEIFYKDWGSGQPIVFSHGWPLSGDDWDPQMLFFLGKGYRVIAHDRRDMVVRRKSATGTISITTPTISRL
jgi:pimeloyl-ACP methyl ester carboxylesterase